MDKVYHENMRLTELRISIASLMHFTLIMSPKGQQLLTLLDHVNKLVPYTIIRQTLKIGNVATMISAMTRVILAKMSVASVTNWIGITNTKDDGVNLLQEYVYLCISKRLYN